MANPEHVEVVLQGVEAIRAWREQNELVRFDLSGADLSTADLHGAYLAGADLDKAVLTRAILIGANLQNVHLRNADLLLADLTAEEDVGDQAFRFGQRLRPERLGDSRRRAARAGPRAGRH